MKPLIIFRADGHAKMGLGHVIRSLALAEMLEDEFDSHFIIRNPLTTLKKQILKACKAIIELPETNNDNQEAQYLVDNYLTGKEIVVLDGYHFRTEYQQLIKNTGCKVVCIDDIYAYHFVADVVINHAGGVETSDYSTEPYTQLFLGPEYALLRKPFRKAANNRTLSGRKDGLFICLGGADPNNVTLKTLHQCEQFGDIGKCYLVIGGAYQHRDSLDKYLKKSQLEIELLSNVSANEMVHYMQQCAKAITPPSTVSYEYLSVGGELYLKTIAENQNNIHRYFIDEELAFDIKTFPQKENESINDMLLKQKATFDGKQQTRFKRLFRGLSLNIRRATLNDTMLYFEWANDPDARRYSFNSTTISLDNHINWFSNKLKAKDCEMHVITLNEKPIGQVRFDFKEKEAIISFSLDRKFRGLGLGTGILSSGIAQFKHDYGNKLLVAGFVKKSNIPSVKAFRFLDFKEEEAEEYENSYKYILE